MAILKIARMGHPLLLKPTTDLSQEAIASDEVQRLVDDMIETMHESDGVGLAAPQVFHNLRLLVVEYEAGNERYPKRAVIPLTVLFNFHIISHSKETDEDWEGCLSIPGIRGLVPRYRSIEVTALDRKGKPVKFKATGFFARVLQHEGDHLDGILFPQRMQDLSKLAFVEEYLRFGLDEES